MERYGMWRVLVRLQNCASLCVSFPSDAGAVVTGTLVRAFERHLIYTFALEVFLCQASSETRINLYPLF